MSIVIFWQLAVSIFLLAMQDEEKIRIKFYSKEDLGLYHSFEWSLSILDSFGESTKYDINQILEFFNIKLILETVNCPRNMELAKFVHYQGYKKLINSLLGRCFSSFDSTSFLPCLRTVEYVYVDDYLNLLNRFNILERIDSNDVRNALDEKHLLLHDVLKQKEWVNRFDTVISDCMKSSNQSAEILIHHYLEEQESLDVKFNMPKSLSPKDKIEILNRYIDCGHFHPNYVGFIAKGTKNKELPIDPKLKQKAERAVEEYWRNNFVPGTIMRLSVESRFEYIEHIREVRVEGTEAIYKFSKKWIDDRHDYQTLVWNLFNLFEMVDAQGRCTFVAKKLDLSTERFFGNLQGKDWYHTSFAFDWEQKIISSKIGAYCKVLKEFNIEIEDLFEWFFNEFIEKNFGIIGFHYNKPSNASSLFEKCGSLCREIEGILLQYKLYQENGEIDRDLINYIENPLNIGELKSLQSRKYVYGKDGDLGRELNSLLSQKLMYGSCFDLKKYQNFVQLVVAKVAKISDFREDAQKYILWLISRGTIFENEGILELNELRYSVLKDLYDNQVASLLRQPPEKQAVLQNLVDNSDVEVKATLFSDLERDYYNFVMNRKSFQNGLNLRNKFAHGLVSDENDYSEAYLELLKIFILVLIKIEEEFSLIFLSKKS